MALAMGEFLFFVDAFCFSSWATFCTSLCLCFSEVILSQSAGNSRNSSLRLYRNGPMLTSRKCIAELVSWFCNPM